MLPAGKILGNREEVGMQEKQSQVVLLDAYGPLPSDCWRQADSNMYFLRKFPPKSPSLLSRMNCSACPQLPLPTVSLRAGVLNFAASAPSGTLLKMQVLQPLSRQGTLTLEWVRPSSSSNRTASEPMDWNLISVVLGRPSVPSHSVTEGGSAPSTGIFVCL